MQMAIRDEDRGTKAAHSVSQLWLDFMLVLYLHTGLNSPKEFINMGWTVQSSPEMPVPTPGSQRSKHIGCPQHHRDVKASNCF